MNDSELTRLQTEWQGLGNVDAALERLAERARRELRRARRSIAVECIAAACSTATCAYFLVENASGPAIGLTAIVVVFNAVYLRKLFQVRGARSRDAARSLDDYGALLRTQLAAETRWLDFAWRATWVLAAILAIWSAWQLLHAREAYALEPWRGIVGFGGIAALLAGTLAWVHHARGRLQLRSRRMDEELARLTLE